MASSRVCSRVPLALCLLVSIEAEALSVEDSVLDLSPLSAPGVIPNTAEVEILGFLDARPAASLVLFGEVGDEDVGILFRASLRRDTVGIDPLYIGVRKEQEDRSLPIMPTAGGFVPGPELDVTSVEFVQGAPSQYLTFSFLDDLLTRDRRSDVFFAFFESMSPGYEILAGFERGQNLKFRTTRVVPEPGTALLLGVGFAGLGVVRRSWRKESATS